MLVLFLFGSPRRQIGLEQKLIASLEKDFPSLTAGRHYSAISEYILHFAPSQKA